MARNAVAPPLPSWDAVSAHIAQSVLKDHERGLLLAWINLMRIYRTRCERAKSYPPIWTLAPRGATVLDSGQIVYPPDMFRTTILRQALYRVYGVPITYSKHRRIASGLAATDTTTPVTEEQEHKLMRVLLMKSDVQSCLALLRSEPAWTKRRARRLLAKIGTCADHADIQVTMMCRDLLADREPRHQDVETPYACSVER